MGNQYVELAEKKGYYYANGECSITISRIDGCISGEFRGIMGAITPESINGFRINQDKTPPEIYLDWHGTGGDERHTLLGKIKNLQQAETWVDNVNQLYSPQHLN